MGLKSVIVHGHFYQPPREDPLSGIIPDEIGAEPFRNWNERIHAECYLPNAALGNFEKISFNIGPTLLKWMAKYDLETYNSIISQERKNYLKYGVGNGIAQAYHHAILPLAPKRDKITQLTWGIMDFKHRYGHSPLGMWLPETAVDLETLTCLADLEIKFTFLAPWQLERSEKTDINQPYYVALPGGRQPMIIFPYHQALSTSVSFQSEATRNADIFVSQFIVPQIAETDNGQSQLLLIASDGELYGHHKVYREKFLAHLLNGAFKQADLELTYPGLWLKSQKPKQFAKIIDYTSWSCHHGIVRWIGECSCTPGATWKAPLRWGFDKLAELLDHEYQKTISQFTQHVWELRNAYIHVFLGEISLEAMLRQFFNKPLKTDEIRSISTLLASQYERQRMFTSCGWFFDSFHRIEPQNNIAYAAQAVWLTTQATGTDLTTKALALLRKVKDERTGLRGDTVFMERYQRAMDFSEEDVLYFNPSSNFST